MKSKTFNLFIISAVILVGTLLVSTYWDALRPWPNKMPLGLGIVVAFALSTAGLVVGFEEIKTVKTSKLWIGWLVILSLSGFSPWPWCMRSRYRNDQSF